MDPRYVRSARIVRRRGFSLLEVTVAAAVLAVLLATSGKLVLALKNQQRSIEARRVAMQSADAVLEYLTNIPWDELTEQSAGGAALPAAMKPLLPGARIRLNLIEEKEPTAKRVSVELTWSGRRGIPPAPVRLTAWVFPNTSRAEEAESNR